MNGCVTFCLELLGVAQAEQIISVLKRELEMTIARRHTQRRTAIKFVPLNRCGMRRDLQSQVVCEVDLPSSLSDLVHFLGLTNI